MSGLHVQVCEEPMERLEEYASIPIAYYYQHVLELSVLNQGLGGFILEERRLEVQQEKNYDALASLSSLRQRFDLTNWGLLVARVDDQRVGGALIAFDSADVEMLEGRQDLAVLWDIRVAPEFRGKRIGSTLFRAVERWSVAHRSRQLKVETQNINVAACKFYAGQGCKLGAINRFAYRDLPDEIQMLWYKDLVVEPS